MLVFLRRERLRHAAAALGFAGLDRPWSVSDICVVAGRAYVVQTQFLAQAQHSATDAFCIKATQLLDYLFQ